MNRMYIANEKGLEPAIVRLFCRASIGASGAPTLNAARSKGIASIARVSAGLYTVTLEDQYVDLLSLNVAVFLASGTPAVRCNYLRLNEVALAARRFQVLLTAADGTATDPDNGAQLYLAVDLKASTV